MGGSIYLKTLRDLRGQTLAWGLGFVGIAAANVLLFPTVQNFPGLVSFLENMPPAFKAMVGDVGAMGQLEGFLRVKVFDAVPLLLSIFVISQGAALIAGEIENKSFDLLMARPVARWRVAVAKYAALATGAVVIILAMVLSLWGCARIIGADITVGYLLASSLNSLPVCFLFAGLALLGSCWFPRARHSSLAVGGLVVASYTFETLRLLSPRIRHLDELSLLAVQKAGVTTDGTVHAVPILVLLGLAVLAVVAAALVLERKDLRN
jgi:ABC-2 type transport system permease protein